MYTIIIIVQLFTNFVIGWMKWAIFVRQLKLHSV